MSMRTSPEIHQRQVVRLASSNVSQCGHVPLNGPDHFHSHRGDNHGAHHVKKEMQVLLQEGHFMIAL